MNSENKNKEQYTFLISLMKGWGIKESWAKIIAGMIIGGLVAAGFLTSCTWNLNAVTPTQNFSSSIHIIPVEEWKK